MGLTMCNGCELHGIYDNDSHIFKMSDKLFSSSELSSPSVIRDDSLMDLYRFCEVCPKNS
jgi:hypothetical protein